MQPDLPFQKGCAVRWILPLVIGWALVSADSPAEAHRSPESLFNSGKDCQSRLARSPKHQKLRSHWEDCIQDFSALLAQHPKNRLEENSLLALGELYAGLHRYSKNDRDRQKSLEYYRQLISNYPNGSSARTAQRRMNTADPPTRPSSLATVKNIRYWVYPDYTRLVLDLDRNMDYRQEPFMADTMRIRLLRTRLGPAAKKGVADLSEGLLRRVTLKPAEPDAVLISINAKNLAMAPKILPLSNPERLVIDLFSRGPAGEATSSGAPVEPPEKTSGVPPVFAQAIPMDVRTIVLDPGHGGKDPGAIGRGGLTEKDIVLDIGLRLRSLIQDRMGKKVIMTRQDDTFIPLDDRTLNANSKKADLFVSIHVNSHPQRATRGIEIYHLGQSSDRRAMAVAARENNVSMKSLGSLDRTVKHILFDLGREYNLDQSQTLAHFTRRSFQTTLGNRYDYDVVDHGVKRAPFYVLLNSNMPSILAEVSFISNPAEEQLLRQGPYRQAIAESLFQGLRTYLSSLKPVS